MRRNDRQIVYRLLDIISDSLREMNDVELELLLDGKAKLGFVSSRTDIGFDVERNLTSEVKSFAEQLDRVDTREAAKELLASIDRPRRREFLVRVAQASGIRIATKDSIARIEQKLIGGTVGLKLRSKAFKEVSFG